MSEFETTAQGCRLATSVGGVLTGRGADMIKDAEKQAAAAPQPEPSQWFTKADEEVVETLIERLRHQVRTEMAVAAAAREQAGAAQTPADQE